MKMNYVLIDYESVQPEDLDRLRDGPFKVKVFLGPQHAKKIATSLAMAMHNLRDRAEYICLETSGPNALDFHIAYYIGVLSHEQPDAFFHVISKDTGFDPLLKHLKSRKIFAQRCMRIADIPLLNPVAPPVSLKERADQVVAHLTRLKASRPRTRKTLISTISNGVFRKLSSEADVAAIFDALCKSGVVNVQGTRLAYQLPAD